MTQKIPPGICWSLTILPYLSTRTPTKSILQSLLLKLCLQSQTRAVLIMKTTFRLVIVSCSWINLSLDKLFTSTKIIFSPCLQIMSISPPRIVKFVSSILYPSLCKYLHTLISIIFPCSRLFINTTNRTKTSPMYRSYTMFFNRIDMRRGTISYIFFKTIFRK